MGGHHKCIVLGRGWDGEVGVGGLVSGGGWSPHPWWGLLLLFLSHNPSHRDPQEKGPILGIFEAACYLQRTSSLSATVR